MSGQSRRPQMRTTPTLPGIAALAALALLSTTTAARAAETGVVLDEATLTGLDGRPAPLFGAAGATALVFFRAPHDRSVETLKMVRGAQAALAGKPVRWVGLVPASSSAEEVGVALATAGPDLPVLVDAEDALYARLKMRLHPAIAMLDAARRLTAV